MSLPVPNDPIVNAGYLDLQGLELSFIAGGTTLGVAAGQARDGTNTNDILLPTAVIINAATNGVINGLDTGVLAASTLYAVFAVGSSNSIGNPGAILSLSYTSPSLPFGYDMCRYIGTVRTSGGSVILDFTQAGHGVDRSIWYAAAIATPITAGAATSFTKADCVGLIPLTAGAVYMEGVLTADAGGTRTMALRATGSSSAAGQTIMSSPASTVTSASLLCPLGSIGADTSVDYLVSNSSAAVALNVFGYLDEL